MGHGVEPTLARMRLEFAVLIGTGVLLAALTGLVSMAVGAPFLTSAHAHPHLPLIGAIPLSSAVVFDLGVFMTVLGATMLVLTGLARARVKTKSTAEVV
jgi:multicomponent K+:H+ antiporter subunit A